MGGEGVFQVMLDALDDGFRFRMLEFQAGDEHAGLAVGVHAEGDGAFGGDEGEAGVVEDVVAVEEDNAGEFLGVEVVAEAVEALLVFGVGDGEGGGWEGRCHVYILPMNIYFDLLAENYTC